MNTAPHHIVSNVVGVTIGNTRLIYYYVIYIYIYISNTLHDKHNNWYICQGAISMKRMVMCLVQSFIMTMSTSISVLQDLLEVPNKVFVITKVLISSELFISLAPQNVLLTVHV